MFRKEKKTKKLTDNEWVDCLNFLSRDAMSSIVENHPEDLAASRDLTQDIFDLMANKGHMIDVCLTALLISARTCFEQPEDDTNLVPFIRRK